MAEIPILETPRLLLKPLELTDAPQIQAVFPQWKIVKFLTTKVPWPYPVDGAISFCAGAIEAMRSGEQWYWSIRRKAAPDILIGVINLVKNENENRGFWLEPKWQGQGLMMEAADAVTDYWFNVLGFPALRAPKAVANEGSRRISEKQGMRIVGCAEKDYVSGRLMSETWEITAEEWRARRKK